MTNAAQLPTKLPEPLTIEEFKDALPPKVKRSINQSVIDEINKTLSEPELFEQYRDNLISYGKVMQEGKFKITSYLDAVKYVCYKQQGETNISAYSKTFPEKIQRFIAEGVVAKDIASYSTAYNKSKLVGLLYKQTMLPAWVYNQDVYQKAINTQVELMISSGSDKVRQEAANSLMTHLKPPEEQKIELSLGTAEDSTIKALRDTTMGLVAIQKKMLQAGAVDAEYVASTSIVLSQENDTNV